MRRTNVKQTTKVVLAIIGALVLAVVGLGVYARVTVGNLLADAGEAGERVELSGTRIERSFDVEEFEEIEVSGGWEVSVREGSSFDVLIETDEALFDLLSVERRGETLRIGSEQKWYWDEKARLRATITMPSVSALRVAGGADVDLDGFTGELLAIGISGAADVTADDSVWDRLEVQVSGAANVDFADSRVTDAEVRLDGAGNVELTMAGGELTGRIGGVGSITYGGEVARESVDIGGVGSVERR
jgi:hypothetical protein